MDDAGTENADGDPDIDDLLDELAALEETVETPAARRRVRETMRVARDVARPEPVFGRVIRGYDRADLAESLLGSVLFGIPMFVEGGTQEVGDFFAGHPLALVGTLAVSVGIVVGILYVADIQDVRITNPILGFVPRRLVGVVGVAALTALATMTAWGRVDWATPWVALCQVGVAFAPMVIGSALGDILPGS